MKTLHLIRHAKSSWADDSLKDIERPLKKRGLNDCRLMAKALSQHKGLWHKVNSSLARRAMMTIESLAKHMDHPNHSQIDERLYTFSAVELLDWWHAQNDVFNHVTLVGHNPAMTELIEHLTGENIGNFPTCAYAQLKFNGHHWHNLAADSCQLVVYITPKQLKI